MRLINSITSDAKPKIDLVLPDSTVASLTLKYIDNQQGWYADLTYGTFAYKGFRLTVNPNILRAFRRIIPFGLALTTTDGYEALFINDFSNGRASLYLLDEVDVIEVEDIIQNVS